MQNSLWDLAAFIRARCLRSFRKTLSPFFQSKSARSCSGAVLVPSSVTKIVDDAGTGSLTFADGNADTCVLPGKESLARLCLCSRIQWRWRWGDPHRIRPRYVASAIQNAHLCRMCLSMGNGNASNAQDSTAAPESTVEKRSTKRVFISHGQKICHQRFDSQN